MGRWITVEEGTEDLIPERKRYDELGAYPRHYSIIAYMEDEEIATLASVHINKPEQPRMSQCKRCQRPIKPQYTHCYRCFNYLQVKRRIQAA